MGFHSAHLTPRWKHMQETLMRILKKSFGFCTLTTRVIFNHQVLRDSFFPLWKATFTMKQPRKLWHWVSSMHKSKRFQEIFALKNHLIMNSPFGIFIEKHSPFCEWYISERKIIKARLLTQNKAKSFFQH